MKFSYNDKTGNDVVQLRNSINSRTFPCKIWHTYFSQSVTSYTDFSDVNFQ